MPYTGGDRFHGNTHAALAFSTCLRLLSGVSNLREQIEADARERLTLPEGRQPSQELQRYKDFLKFENNRLLAIHREGAKGHEVCAGRSIVIDELLRHILAAVQTHQRETGLAAAPKFALVAIGGYGRGELNPHSDIDIMFLHESDSVTRGKPIPALAALTDGLLYTLWDIGLKVGHSVRSPMDAIQAANSDMQSKTSLIEARLVTGDATLFQYTRDLVIAKCVRGHERAYIQARIEDQTARRAKYGNSASMQEPNIKNGCGGLRDYQNLLWMAFFKYRVQSLDELESKELITAIERELLDTAYDFLLWIRNELHYQAKRAVDVLGKNLQPAVALALGYEERSPSKRIERFMRDVYTHLRNIYLITRTLEERLALLPQPARMPSLRDMLQRGKRRATQQIVDGFKISNGQIHGTARTFRDQPRRLMRVFLHAQQRGLRLHPDLAQIIRNELDLVDREFLKDSHVHETFLEILNQRGNVASILRSMHEVGFLGKYLPEFGRLTCLVQHEFYHQYTADEHTLVCLAQLDRVWDATTPPFSNYTTMLQELERPFVLYLALLLHDAGKAFDDGNHAQTGGEIANEVAKRLSLDGATTHSLRLIIENHLAMVQISQRRDLEDESVIRSFAGQIQNAENLVMLTLHTFADSQGTSDQLWNGFKDSLLLTLLNKTMSLFRGGTDFQRAEVKQMELLADEVKTLLPPTFSKEEVDAHFAHLPSRYFHIHTARQITSDVSLAHRFMHQQLAEEEKALEPVVTWHNEPDRGYTSVHICTWDRAGLFSTIAGSLSAAGLNILSAQIFTRTDGFILDTFFVTDARTGLLANREEKEKFEKLLRNALNGEVNFDSLISTQRKNELYRSVDGERIETAVTFDNDISRDYTVIDVETEDRVGLLFMISQTLSELGLNIALAKVVTEKGAAIDTFYVTTAEKEKVTDSTHLAEIRQKLEEVTQNLAPAI
jgi:[protein-PII] uridylyltransferase